MPIFENGGYSSFEALRKKILRVANNPIEQPEKEKFVLTLSMEEIKELITHIAKEIKGVPPKRRVRQYINPNRLKIDHSNTNL